MLVANPAHPSLAEQLAPVASRMREGRSRIRPVSQVSVRLDPSSAQHRFQDSIDSVLRWANNRAGRHLPSEAWKRKSFELLDVGSQRVAAVAIEEPRIWAMRLDDADKSLPLRTWITEVGVGVDPGGQILFAARLICATRGDDAPFDRTLPGFVKQIIKDGPTYLDGRHIGGNPWIIDNEQSTDELVDFLESAGRRAPVIVFALPEKSIDPADAILSIADFDVRTLGCAHVCVLTGPASFHLTDRLGRELSVFRQAVRTYLPGFTRWKDQPYRHPLALPERIASWPDGGSAAYMRFLVDQTIALSVQSPDREDELPSFMAIRQAAAQTEREHARKDNRSDKELLDLALDENATLQAELGELRDKDAGLMAELEIRLDEARQAAQEAKAHNFALRERIRALEQRLSASASSATQPIPATTEGIQTWCHENLSGWVVLHNRAFQGVKKSVYRDTSLIYRALLLLRDRYVPMRLSNDAGLKAAYDAGLRELHLEESAVGDGWKEHPEQYTVSYDGKPRRMDRHLKLGTSHDPARAFRLYFFWDEDSQVVVVGWLPSHLDNALT